MTCPSCPACGAAETYTAQSGIVTGHWLRRCLSCGREFDTVEVYAIEHPRYVLRMHTKEILSRRNGGGQ